MKLLKYILILFLIFSYNLFSNNADSLEVIKYLNIGNSFQNNNPDSALYYHFKAYSIKKIYSKILRGEIYKQIGWDYFMISEYDKALLYLDTALIYSRLFQKFPNDSLNNKSKKLYTEAIGYKAAVYYKKSDYDIALNYYSKALLMSKEINDKKNEAANLGNIGLVYYRLGNYKKALNYYYKALSINEKIDYKKGVAANLSNIGIIYKDQKEYNKALKYYFKASEINKSIGNLNSYAINLGNIGIIYASLNDINKALFYYKKSLALFKKIKDKKGQLRQLTNIGNLLTEKNNDYENAIKYYNKSIVIANEIRDKRSLAIAFSNLGNAYLRLKKYKLAEEKFKEAEKINKSIGSIINLKYCYKGLSDLYELTNDYENAFKYYKKFRGLNDSLINIENSKVLIEKEMKYRFEKQKAIDDAKYEKQLAIEKKEQEKQKIIIYATVAGLFVVILSLIIIINRLQVTRNQNKIIEAQKRKVEQQKNIVEKARKSLEIKNKEITDSIIYAKRLQEAILPSNKKLAVNLKNGFVVYLPKDIVAGDFYWMETVVSETSTTVYFAAADCTGHGVPGAMVSIACSNALNQAVKELKTNDTGKILDKTRELIIENFSNNEHTIQDGMDISFCALDKQTKKLSWSGANNPLWIVRNVELEMLNDESKNEYSTFNTQHLKLIEVKPDKQPIGKVENPQPFTTHTIELQKGDTIYLFTDGFADQFGGEKGKKFKYKPFKELLLSIQDKSMDEQKQVIEETFISWKGDLEQVDDVCVIGVRI
jgi:tetratricopeptide (TPR) repeat protein